MTTHVPLPDRVDPKLAKGVIRQELRGMADSDVFEDVVGKLACAVLSRTLYRRTLDPGYLWRITEDAAKGFAASKACIHVERRRPARTTLPSKTWRVVEAHMVEPGVDGLAALSTIRLKVMPRGFALGTSKSPVAFLEHAAERLLQRLPTDKPRDPMRTIGKLLHETINFLTPSLRIADATPGRSLGVPFGDGLLLGTVTSVPFNSLQGGALVWEGDTLEPTDAGPGALCPALIPVGHVFDMYPSEVLTFLVKTYVGPKELRPDQRKFLEEVRRFDETYGDTFRTDAWTCLYPGAAIQDLKDAAKSHMKFGFDRPLMDTAYADLARILTHPDTASAIGAPTPATTVPEAYWKVGRRTREERHARLEHEPTMRAVGGMPYPTFDEAVRNAIRF